MGQFARVLGFFATVLGTLGLGIVGQTALRFMPESREGVMITGTVHRDTPKGQRYSLVIPESGVEAANLRPVDKRITALYAGEAPQTTNKEVGLPVSIVLAFDNSSSLPYP
ncbi:MAG: hypothetical protein ABUL72_04985, partial [Armatimonadota bacterium]